MPVVTTHLKPEHVGLDSYINEGVLFTMLRNMMPSNPDDPFLHTEVMQEIRDMWRDRYDAMSPYSNDELRTIALDNIDRLPEALADDLRSGVHFAGMDNDKRSAFRTQLIDALNTIGIHIQTDDAKDAAKKALEPVLDYQPRLKAGVPNGAATTKALVAFESVLREPSVIEKIGEHHVIDDITKPASVMPVRDEQGRALRENVMDDDNIQAFIDTYRMMRNHVRGYYDYEVEGAGHQIVHVRSHMVPISPLDPDFRNRTCTYDAGAAQLMFAVVPMSDGADNSFVTARADVNAVNPASWRVDYLGDVAKTPVAVAYETEDGRFDYIGAGHTDRENNRVLRYDAQLATMTDAIGLSDVRFALTDDESYRAVAASTVDAWNAYAEHASRDEVAQAADEQRLLSKRVSAPMVDHLMRRGGELELGVDRFAGQVLVRDLRSKLTVRLFERPESDTYTREHWVGKVRTRSADDYEFTIRDAHTGESLVGNTRAAGNLSDARALSLYTPEIRARELDFLLGYNVETPLEQLRGAGATYPDAYGAANRRKRTFVVSRSQQRGTGHACFVETPLATDTIDGRDVVICLKSGITRNNDPDMPQDNASRWVVREPDDQALIKYENGTGRPYRQDADGNYLNSRHELVDAPMYDAVTYSDMLRYAIQTARDTVQSMIGADELIDHARAYLLAETSADAKTHIPSFDCDGELTDEFVIDARRGLWRVLTGAEQALEKPWIVSDDEIRNDPSMLFDGERLGKLDLAGIDDEKAFDAAFEERVAYVQDYVAAVVERRIGDFDVDDERGGRFNPANVLAYAPGYDGGMGSQRLVTLMRRCNIAGDELLGQGAVGGRDAFALRLADRIDGFKEDRASTLEVLRDKDDDLSRYKANVLEMVRDAASLWSAEPLSDTDVAIDNAGLVRYTFKHVANVTVDAASDGATSADQREKNETVMQTTNGYIGRFALPERTHAGALRSQGRFSDKKIFHTQSRAFILPQDGGSNRTERTRAITFEDSLRSYVFDQVAYDVRTAYRSATNVPEVGDFDSMRGAYQTDDTSFVISADRYDYEWALTEMSKSHKVQFAQESWANYFADAEGAAKMPYVHGIDAPKSAEALLAREQTAMGEVNFSNQMLAADVRGRLRVSAGRDLLVSERYRDAMTLADGKSLAVMTEQDAQVFDMYQVPDNAKQTTKRHLNVGASVSRDAAPIFDSAHRSCAIGELDQFKHKSSDMWNRVRMGQANEMQELGHDSNAHVVMAGGGGFTQNDGVIATREWCVHHGVIAGNGEFRPLTVGDKISDDHGNKGVIAVVLDVNDTEQQAIEKGESYHNLWKFANENCTVIEDLARFNDPSDLSKGAVPVSVKHCNFDIVMNSVSFMSRLNGATLVDGMTSEQQPLTMLDGSVAEGGIFTTNISIHDQLVDKGSHDHDSHTGWQLACAVIDRCPHLMAEMYGDNVRGWRRLREALNVSCGCDFAPDGTIVSAIDTTDTSARRLIDYQRVSSATGMAPISEVAAETPSGSEPVKMSVPGALRMSDTVVAAKHAIDVAGGVLPIPFQLKFPERRLASQMIDDDARERMGLEPGQDAVVGGGSLPVVDRIDPLGNQMFALPIESAPGRAGLESRGRQQRHDHMRQYAQIISNAVKCEQVQLTERAFIEERDRIVAGINLFNAEPDNEHAIDPDAPMTAFYAGGLLDTPSPSDTNKTPVMTWRQLAVAYEARIAGAEAASDLLETLGGDDMDRQRLKASLNASRVRTFASERSALAADAQKAFTEMSNEVWARNFTTSSNNVKNLLMRSTIRDSSYNVWTANPALDIDTVALSPDCAHKLGITEDDLNDPTKRVALWRSPVLRSMNIAAFKFVINPGIKGVAVNPAVTTRISGDFDGDHVALYFPKDDATQDEIRTELSFERYLIDEHIEPDMDGGYEIERGGRTVKVPKYELGIDAGLDAKLGRQFNKKAGEQIDAGTKLACIAQYDWDQFVAWRTETEEKLDAIEFEHNGQSAFVSGLTDENGHVISADTTDKVREFIKTTLTEQRLHTRDSLNRSAFKQLNEGIKAAQAASISHGVIDFSDKGKFVESVFDATVRYGVKGKISQAEHLLSCMGYVPNEPELISAIAYADGGAVVDGDARYESLTAYLKDRERFGLTEMLERGVDADSFVKIDELAVDEQVKDALHHAWRDMRFAEDQSTSLAMNAKTTITAVVGVLPQHGHKALNGQHTLVADVTEPMYQMSLDFKLDGEDALRKIPWVDVWVSTLRRGQLYEELLDPNAFAEGAVELDPTKLTPCAMAANLSAVDDRHRALTSDDLKVTLKNIYTACGQSLAASKIDAFVDAMSSEAEVNGERVRVARPLDKIAETDGSMLMRLGFDSSRDGATMIEAIKRNSQVFDAENDDVHMACGYVRQHMGCPIENKKQARRYMTTTDATLSASMRERDADAQIMNTRGLDAAVSAASANGVRPRVAVFYQHDRDAGDEITDDLIKRHINMVIQPALNAVDGDGERVYDLVSPQDGFNTSEVSSAISMINQADLVVMIGERNCKQPFDVSYVNEAGDTVTGHMNGIDILSHAARHQTAVCELSDTYAKPAARQQFIAQDKGSAAVPRSSMYRFDRGERLGDYMYHDNGEAPTRSNKNWAEAMADGHLTVSIIGSLPEEHLIENPNGNKDARTQASFMRWDHGRTEPVGRYRKLVDLLSDQLENQFKQLDGRSGGTGVMTVVVDGERGAGGLGLEAALRVASKHDGRVMVSLEPAFADQERNWESEATEVSAKSKYRQNYFSEDSYRRMAQDAHQVVTPDLHIVTSRGGVEQMLSASAKREAICANRCRIVDKSNVVMTMCNRNEHVPERSQRAVDTVLDYARTKGKTILEINSDPRMRAGEKRVSLVKDLMRRYDKHQSSQAVIDTTALTYEQLDARTTDQARITQQSLDKALQYSEAAQATTSQDMSAVSDEKPVQTIVNAPYVPDEVHSDTVETSLDATVDDAVVSSDNDCPMM